MSPRKIKKHEYRDLAADVSRLLAEFDPNSLVELGAPRGEFDSEAIQLLGSIAAAQSSSDISHAISRVFGRAFDPSEFSTLDCENLAERLFLEIHPRAAALLLPRGTV